MKFLNTQAYINGEWTNANKTFEVKNPATGEVLANVPDLNETHTRSAIEAASTAFPAWSSLPAKQRSKILRKWFQLIMANRSDLGKLLTAEQGKPLKEGIGEIVYGAGFVEWFAEEAKRAYGDVIPNSAPGSRILAIKQPVGVVAAITPWNFPNAMITRKVAPAIAAGCTVVIKPAEQTPLSALALAELAEEAGFPPGVLNVITTNHPAKVGKELTSNPLVKKLSFTGSTEVGKRLYAACAPTVKKISLELGGNAPFIVFDDADIDAAIDGAIVSKYRNSGQTCICSNRLFVHDKVYDEFIEKYASRVAELPVGNGFEDASAIGPLIDTEGFDKVQNLVSDAVARGAKVITGGEPHKLGGTFFQPTVIANATAEMMVSSNEIFGPVAPVYRFTEEEDVITQANNTAYGLAAYFYGRDVGRIWRVAEALEYGMVGVNTGIISEVQAPFGGIKESGFGREGSKYGMDDYLNIKYINLSGL
jgi:succinate-semialdehyde dehydrogenase/glutarate-semialdehyde dehydrogenase